jgi:hypothetical protein
MQFINATELNRNPRDLDSCYAAPDTTACAAFIEESRMQFINATELNRNPGDLGHPSMCCLVIPLSTCHRQVGSSGGPRAVLILPTPPLGPFRPPKPECTTSRGTHLNVLGQDFELTWGPLLGGRRTAGRYTSVGMTKGRVGLHEVLLLLRCASVVYSGNLTGKVQAQQVSFHSAMAAGGNEILYSFSGTANVDSMSGTVALGEYGRAQWSATKETS